MAKNSEWYHKNSVIIKLKSRGESRMLISEGDQANIYFLINPFSANPTKWSNTLKQFVGCC